MKQRSLFVFCLMLGMAGYVAAQSKSVTNADLKRYQQDRLKAEQDYLENYARLGMPSPEEIERRREKSRVEMEKLSEKLRQEELQRYAITTQQRADQPSSATYDSSGYPGYYYPYWDGAIWSASWVRPRFRRHHVTPYGVYGHVGGGQFWPAPGPPRWSSGHVGGGQFWPSPGAGGSGAPIRHAATGGRR